MWTGQEPFVNIPEETIREALKVLLGILKASNFLDLSVCKFLVLQYSHVLLSPCQM